MNLHPYQERAVRYMSSHPRCILSVGMGLGKTAAVLHHVAERMPKSLLIVAPKRVAESVWLQEAEKWGLTAVAERMIIVKGAKKARFEAWNNTHRPYKIVGRDNLGDIFADKDFDPFMRFDMVVLDELTSFKTIGSKRTQRAAALARLASRCIGLTGTFLANGAIDIYGQAYSVGLFNGKTNFYSWRARYFRDVMAGSGMAWHKWKLLIPLAEVLQPIRNGIFTLDSKDYLAIPPVTIVPHAVKLSEDEQRQYDSLEAFLGCNIDGVGVSVEEGAKFAKLQTMCDGFLYTGQDYKDGNDFFADVVRGERSSKLEAVADFCAQCYGENEPVLLFYAFRAEEAWLRELLTERGVPCCNVKDSGAIDKWMAGEFEGVMMAHPASAGHGLNLQGGGRILVWSTLTYNYEYYAQANARLARQGQRQAVQIHIFTTKGTIEDGKQKSLAQKDKEQSQFLELTK